MMLRQAKMPSNVVEDRPKEQGDDLKGFFDTHGFVTLQENAKVGQV